MSQWDRIGRSLFVALAVGLAWGIRGDFGHSIGAMYPGAILGLSFAFVSGQRSLVRWMPIVATLTAMGIGSGGTMSYGILHGYAQSDSFLNYAYGFLTLFLQGAAWGTFGGALLGLMLERRPMQTTEWLGLLGSIFVGAWLFSFVVVNLIGFQVNPPRNNISVVFLGGAIGQLLWLAWAGRRVGLRGAALGFIGFGLGMSGGRLLGNLANMLQEPLGFTINHWNVMEVSCGMIGGGLFCYGMVNRAYPDPPEDRNIRLCSFYGALIVLGLLPLWHRLARIDPEEKLVAWSATLEAAGWQDPHALARSVLWMIDGVCLMGFLGAGAWMVLLSRDRPRGAAFPTIWLTLTMLLFQKLHALTFFQVYPEEHVHMGHVFWIIFFLMFLYVAFARPSNEGFALPGAEDEQPRFPWRGWLLVMVAGLAAILLLAGWINGEATMKSANTRWPVWSWSEGPFPGREASP